jgi:anti-anti-sigma factor
VGDNSAVPLFRVSVMRTGDTAVLRLEGELDCAGAPQLAAVLARLMTDPEQPPSTIIADAGQLSFVDIAGLEPLVDARRKLPPGCVLRVRNVGQQAAKVIRLLDLEATLGVHDDD